MCEREVREGCRHEPAPFAVQSHAAAWRHGESEGQAWSLVSRSHQRCGRINVPSAAIAQIVARSTKLAMRKNPPFISCTESGPMTAPPCYDLIVPPSLRAPTTIAKP